MTVRAIALVLSVLGACGGGSSGPATSPSPALPPNDFESLAEIFDPQLEPLGLRLTRGGSYVRERENYSPAESQKHLALYVEPTGAYSKRRYLEGITTVTALFAPEVFDRWPGLESFDVCQEPLPSVDASDEPPPVTAVDMTEAAARALDWDTATLEDVIDASLQSPPQLHLVVADELRESSYYERAQQRALDD